MKEEPTYNNNQRCEHCNVPLRDGTPIELCANCLSKMLNEVARKSPNAK